MPETKHDPEDTIRYSFDLPKSLHDKLCHYLPYGTKKYFLVRIIEHAVDGMECGGYAVVGAILQGDYNPLIEAVREKDRTKWHGKTESKE